MRRSRKFCQRPSGGPTLIKKNCVCVGFLSLVDEGRKDRNTTFSGPSLALQLNAIYMALRWHPDDGPTLNVGLVACDFSGDLDQYC